MLEGSIEGFREITAFDLQGQSERDVPMGGWEGGSKRTRPTYFRPALRIAVK